MSSFRRRLMMRAWVKHYVLYVTQGANTTVTVNRTSSPYWHAGTGTLSNGTVIHFGDVLQVSVSVNSGYTLQSFTLNGSAWTSGNLHTVSGNVTVESGAISSASWHTVWTGSKSITRVLSSYADVVGQFTVASDVALNPGRPTRITGTGYYYTSNTFTNVELPTVAENTALVVTDTYSQYMKQPSSGGTVTLWLNAYVKGTLTAARGITVTEIQQYY